MLRQTKKIGNKEKLSGKTAQKKLLKNLRYAKIDRAKKYAPDFSRAYRVRKSYSMRMMKGGDTRSGEV